MSTVESVYSVDDLNSVREIIAAADIATLCTLLPGDEGLEPYASVTLVADDPRGQPLLFVSELSDHTRNMRDEPDVSLMIFPDAGGQAKQRLNQPRVSIQADAEFLDRAENEDLIDRFVARHPEAKVYRRFSDFCLVRLNVSRVHFIGGFGHARWYDGADLFPAEDGFDAGASGASAAVALV